MFQALMDTILEVRYTDLEQEYQCCTALLEGAQQAGDPYAEAFARTYLGDYYIAQNDSSRSIDYLHAAKELCLRHGLQVLLPQIYNLLGICHETYSDEQTAMRCYLDALDLLDPQRDAKLRCILYNNIASNFETHNDYETAYHYYAQAADLAAKQGPSLGNYDYLLLRVWGNLCQAALSMGRHQEASRYLELLEQADVSEHQVSRACMLYRGRCLYMAAQGRAQEASDYARRLLATVGPTYHDKQMAFDSLFSVCDALISLGDAPRSKEVLDRILEMHGGSEFDRVLTTQRLRVRYCEAFATEAERYAAYRDYFQANQALEKQNHLLRAGGMQAIVHLHEETKAKRAAEQAVRTLSREAHVDELTGLYNRRYFNKLSVELLAEPEALGIIMMDVDYFKEYNDTYGHDAGDQALKTVSRILQEAAPRGIVPCRYGGDEFICLCAHTPLEDIAAYVDAVRAQLADLGIPHAASKCGAFLTLSCGFHHGGRDVGHLMVEADRALYRSKLTRATLRSPIK